MYACSYVCVYIYIYTHMSSYSALTGRSSRSTYEFVCMHACIYVYLLNSSNCITKKKVSDVIFFQIVCMCVCNMYI